MFRFKHVGVKFLTWTSLVLCIFPFVCFFHIILLYDIQCCTSTSVLSALIHQDLAIEISDRDPTDHPQGIPYKVMAEACIPGINLTDLGSIFEEHRIVKNLSVFLNTHQLELDGGGVFGEDENKFIFGHVLVGRKAKSRFKISNPYKVCHVVIPVSV